MSRSQVQGEALVYFPLSSRSSQELLSTDSVRPCRANEERTEEGSPHPHSPPPQQEVLRRDSVGFLVFHALPFQVFLIICD